MVTKIFTQRGVPGGVPGLRGVCDKTFSPSIICDVSKDIIRFSDERQ